jgi:hypothetical protein
MFWCSFDDENGLFHVEFDVWSSPFDRRTNRRVKRRYPGYQQDDGDHDRFETKDDDEDWQHVAPRYLHGLFDPAEIVI